jgi:hypothetical protein
MEHKTLDLLAEGFGCCGFNDVGASRTGPIIAAIEIKELQTRAARMFHQPQP